MGHFPGLSDLHKDVNSKHTNGRCKRRHKVAVVSINLVLILILYFTHQQVQHVSTPREMRITHISLSENGKDFIVIDKYEAEDNNETEHFTSIPPKDEVLSQQIDVNMPINCTLIRENNKPELERTKFKMWHEARNGIHETLYKDMTQDCDTFTKERRYVRKPLSTEEAEFPIAYSIRMHKDVDQVERLLRMVYMPQNIYCIHVDRKSSKYIHEAMASIARCFPNVFLSSQQFYYVYGGFSPVQADLTCMRDLLSSTVPWKYFLNLAGSEFPLKTNLELVRIFNYLNGSNEIESYDFPKEYNYRLDHIHRNQSGRSIPTRRKKMEYPDKSIRLRKGCSYNTFSRQFVEWVVSDQRAQSFIGWAKDMNSPDEVVWATLNTLRGAPGGYTYQHRQSNRQSLSRAIVWSWMISSCKRKHYIHQICIFSSADLSELLPRPELFANKFDRSYDRFVLDCLTESLTHRMVNPDPERFIKWRWIENLPHIKRLIDNRRILPHKSRRLH